MFWNTILFDVTSYWRCQHSTWSRVYVTVESPSVCLSVRLYVPSIASTQVNSALHPSRIAKSNTSFGWGKGGNVTSVGLQVTLCGPIWHVSSRSGVATLRTAIHLLLTYLPTTAGGFAAELQRYRYLLPACGRRTAGVPVLSSKSEQRRDEGGSTQTTPWVKKNKTPNSCP